MRVCAYEAEHYWAKEQVRWQQDGASLSNSTSSLPKKMLSMFRFRTVECVPLDFEQKNTSSLKKANKQQQQQQQQNHAEENWKFL